MRSRIPQANVSAWASLDSIPASDVNFFNDHAEPLNIPVLHHEGTEQGAYYFLHLLSECRVLNSDCEWAEGHSIDVGIFFINQSRKWFWNKQWHSDMRIIILSFQLILWHNDLPQFQVVAVFYHRVDQLEVKIPRNMSLEVNMQGMMQVINLHVFHIVAELVNTKQTVSTCAIYDKRVCINVKVIDLLEWFNLFL